MGEGWSRSGAVDGGATDEAVEADPAAAAAAAARNTDCMCACSAMSDGSLPDMDPDPSAPFPPGFHYFVINRVVMGRRGPLNP